MVETNQTPESQAPVAGQDNPSSSTPTKADVPTLGENFGKHDNTVVAHKIADHKRFVQVSVMVDGQWVNINNTLDQYNMQQDLNKVAKVVNAQVALISDAVGKANKAVDSANKAVESSNTNKTAIGSINSAVEEAKKTANDALEKLKNIASDDTIKSIQDALNNTGKNLDQLKQDQLDQIATVKTQIVDAVKEAKEATDSLNAQLEPLQTAVKDAQDNAVVATQTAKAASATAIDAKGDATTAMQTAKQVTVDMKNVKSDVLAVKATADQATITAGNAASDAATAKVAASGASLTATNAKNDAAQAKATADELSTRLTSVEGKVTANATAVDQTSKQLALKADQTTVDDIKKTATDNAAAVQVLSNEVKSKVDSTTVNKIIDDKGYTTAETAQALIDQTANKISGTITNLKTTVDKNGKLISSTSDQLSNFTQTLDGLQTTVKNKASQDQLTQLSDQLTAKVSTKDFESELALLKDNVNLRIKKGDIISQLNLEAGGNGLIEVANGKGKLMLDADSVIFGNKAFIPSASIIDIEADKIRSGTLDAGQIRVVNLTADNIHGGTLDVGNMHVKNFSANDIETGTLRGINLIAGDDKEQFSIKGPKIIWHSDSTNSNGDPAVAQIGANEYIDWDTDHRYVKHTFFGFASNDDIVIGTNVASYDKEHDDLKEDTYSSGPNITINTPHKAPIYDELQGITLSSGDTNMSVMSSLNNLQSQIEFNTKNKIDFNLHPLADGDINGSTFNIQKDGCVGAYFGQGDNGNEINLVTAGDGGAVNITGPLNVNGTLSVNGPLHLNGAKNAVVKTTQGYVGINAYETADYYFGDIGESNTGANGHIVIGIDKIFGETVNTTVQYQVFITPYSDCHVWVDQRFGNRFVVKSDQPNAQFGWEIKAKRKGYENYRLRHVDGMKEKGDFKL